MRQLPASLRSVTQVPATPGRRRCRSVHQLLRLAGLPPDLTILLWDLWPIFTDLINPKGCPAEGGPWLSPASLVMRDASNNARAILFLFGTRRIPHHVENRRHLNTVLPLNTWMPLKQLNSISDESLLVTSWDWSCRSNAFNGRFSDFQNNFCCFFWQ